MDFELRVLDATDMDRPAALNLFGRDEPEAPIADEYEEKSKRDESNFLTNPVQLRFPPEVAN
jgi:hypothetical protein